MRIRTRSAMAGAMAAGAAFLVCVLVALTLAVPSAWADEADDAQRAVDDAQATLEEAEQSMQTLEKERDDLKAELEALQKRLDETAEQAKESQQALIEGREALGKAAAYEYREGGSANSLLTLLLEADSFNELVRNISYLGSIVEYRSDEIAAQQQRCDEFESLLDELNDQKAEHSAKLEELEKKQDEAARVVADANSKLKNAKGDQAARLAELQKKAERVTNSGDANEPVIVDDADTVNRQDVVPPSVEVKPDPNPNPPGGNTGSGGGSSNSGGSSDVSWSKGVASAYGGATDPYTKNPATTATGAVCDDNSMGVAVPMAWSKYWKYYGRTVEISYGGMTVLATVNDCGGMGGGSRVLDLQPGVWKAFGFKSCSDWGLRTVSYRFL